ncbi:MAG: hypothetical protein ABIA37_02550 [Candidatus Woesearchaeota archaeon]
MKKLEPGKTNTEGRLNFVSYWADYVRTHPDQQWGKQHNKLINSVLQSAKYTDLTPKQYLEIKGEKCSR